MLKERLPLNNVCLPPRNVCLSISTLQVPTKKVKSHEIPVKLSQHQSTYKSKAGQKLFCLNSHLEGFALQLLMFHTLLLLHHSPNHITWHARNPMQRQESKSQILLFSPRDSGVSTFKMLRFLWLQFTAARPYFSGPPVLQDIVCLGSRASQFQQVLQVIHLPWRNWGLTVKLQGPTLQDMEVYAKLGVDVSLEYNII